MREIVFTRKGSGVLIKKRVPQYRVQGYGDDDSKACYRKHSDPELQAKGYYELTDVECLHSNEYIIGSPRSRAPAQPRTPRNSKPAVPSPKELRKPAPRRNDVPYSWE